ncbi:MAG: fatty acid desaturase family protein [Solirubrobacterales bacterium]
MSTTTIEKESTNGGIENPLHRLTDEQLEQLGKELDAIHDEVYESLGERDRTYITSMIAFQRRLLVFARIELLAARFSPAWLVGTATLGTAKIIENMEIGHNVMHGQWDWMNDPKIHSDVWDWDTASTAESWKHSHNYIHHTYTNIRGKDKDLGYEIMRIDPEQKWHPIYLFQPLYNLVLMGLFEWGVALHDLDLEAFRKGEKSTGEMIEGLKGISGKARDQITKDYIAWPLVSAAAAGAVAFLWHAREAANTVPSSPKRKGGFLRDKLQGRKRGQVYGEAASKALETGRKTFKATVKANATGNVIRNLWTHAIIFCGHFPDQTYTFSEDETRDETKGGWYIRQLIGAANIQGSPMFHVMSGNLGYQVEHHLFPDMPSTRYAEIAPRVKEICERYDLPYNSGPFFQQWGMVNRTIARLAFPGGKPRQKPGPYKGGDGEVRPANANELAAVRSNGANGGAPQSRGERPESVRSSGPERGEEQEGVKVETPEG